MQRTLRLISLALMLNVFMQHTLMAAPIQSLAEIKKIAQRYAENEFMGVEGNISVKAVKLDPRLRLAKCDQPLETVDAFNTKRGGQITVNVQCNGSKRWTLYVPVQVQVLQTVAIMNHALPRKSIITRDDVRLEERDINRVNQGFFTNLEDVIGKTLLRSVGNGLTVSPMHIDDPDLVKRGQKVTLIAKSDGFAVSVRGQAMSDGAVGDRIKVKNLSSERIIEGIITQDGQVATHM